MENALDIQIGGKHYKMLPYQPVDFITKTCANFIQGNIIKYVSRYKHKNGREDLLKVLHYAQLGAELHPKNFVLYSKVEKDTDEYIKKNSLDELVGKIIEKSLYQDWLGVSVRVSKLLKDYE